MTKIEIIEETVEFYRNNPRAYDPLVGCLYVTSSGLRCAHSRCLNETLVDLKAIQTCQNARDVIRDHGDNVHKEQYRGHSIDFWMDIQQLHDTCEYWSGTELSEEGKLVVERLKIAHNEEAATC
jgi:hypothetical protein